MNQQMAIVEPEPRELAALVQGMQRHLRMSLAIIAGYLVLAAILTFVLPRSYTAEAALSYEPQTPLIKGGGQLPLTDAQRDAEIDAQLAAVATLPVAEDVARAVDLGANPRLAREVDTVLANSERRLSREEALGTALLDHVKARRVGQTREFTIAYTAGSAEQAARIANLFSAAYLKATVRQKAALAGAGARQLDTRIAELRGEVGDADGKLAAFRLANHLLEAPDSPALEQGVAAIRGQLADARGQAALAGTRSASANGTTVVGGGYGGSVDTTPVSALTQQRAATSADLATLLGRYGEKYPDVIAARQKLAEFDAQLAEAMHGNRAAAAVEARAASARAGALTGSLNAAEARLATVLSHNAQLRDLQNSALALSQAYQDVLKIRADQTAQSVLIQPDAQVIAPAVPPQRARFPRLGIDLLAGLVLGLVTAVMVAFIRETWLHRLASVDDIARWLDVDYFAPLPTLAATLRHPGTADPAEAVLLHPRSTFAESFRSLATAALFAGRPAAGTTGRVIGITSALAGEGKTTTAIAMGRVLTAAGTKVVLVEGDRRAAGDVSRGWGEVVSGKARLDEVLRRDSSGLAVLPAAAGTASPDAPGFAALIAALCQDYEVVIIDGPAILTGSHGWGMLKCVDALVLLAQWRSTPVKSVRAALRQIAASGERCSGVALSRVGRSG